MIKKKKKENWQEVNSVFWNLDFILLHLNCRDLIKIFKVGNSECKIQQVLKTNTGHGLFVLHLLCFIAVCVRMWCTVECEQTQNLSVSKCWPTNQTWSKWKVNSDLWGNSVLLPFCSFSYRRLWVRSDKLLPPQLLVWSALGGGEDLRWGINRRRLQRQEQKEEWRHWRQRNHEAAAAAVCVPVCELGAGQPGVWRLWRG